MLFRLLWLLGLLGLLELLSYYVIMVISVIRAIRVIMFITVHFDYVVVRHSFLISLHFDTNSATIFIIFGSSACIRKRN